MGFLKALVKAGIQPVNPAEGKSPACEEVACRAGHSADPGQWIGSQAAHSSQKNKAVSAVLTPTALPAPDIKLAYAIR
jgi:hypothetical protein